MAEAGVGQGQKACRPVILAPEEGMPLPAPFISTLASGSTSILDQTPLSVRTEAKGTFSTRRFRPLSMR